MCLCFETLSAVGNDAENMVTGLSRLISRRSFRCDVCFSAGRFDAFSLIFPLRVLSEMNARRRKLDACNVYIISREADVLNGRSLGLINLDIRDMFSASFH